MPFSATVRAVDQFGNNAADYAGTVTLTSSDPPATLPAPYAYAPTDAAQHTFTGIVLHTVGTQTVTATDSNGFTIRARRSASPPAKAYCASAFSGSAGIEAQRRS